MWIPVAFPNTMWMPVALPNDSNLRILRHIRAARAIRTIATHVFYDIFGPPEPSDIQPAIGIPAYLLRLRSPEWVSRRVSRREHPHICSVCAPQSGSAGGHPFHYYVGITAYLQCLGSFRVGQHGEKWPTLERDGRW